MEILRNPTTEMRTFPQTEDGHFVLAMEKAELTMLFMNLSAAVRMSIGTVDDYAEVP